MQENVRSQKTQPTGEEMTMSGGKKHLGKSGIRYNQDCLRGGGILKNQPYIENQRDLVLPWATEYDMTPLKTEPSSQKGSNFTEPF